MNQLPIADYKDQILSTIAESEITIIEAATGAGKSTQVPQYLLQAGYDIVVTEPRRLAVRTVAERVAYEYGGEVGDVVGYRTSQERCNSRNTRCLFVTDGLALVRELMGAGKHTVLVIDEVHEWNMNIEVLVGWVRRLAFELKLKFKVVIMSATMESLRLSEYFGGAPIISVPGRLFPIEEKLSCGDMLMDTVSLLRQGRNVLVFQPGKSEINKFIEDLREMGITAEILPLHGELSPQEQARCFKSYHRPKCVVSTNVAQTSITIDDIDAVVDSGIERRTEIMDGVQGLYLKPVSDADLQQRCGRAGRTKPGIYINAASFEIREKFPKAEILRSLLDQTVLRLAVAGFDAEKLEFFHQPDKREIHAAKKSLKILGLMDGAGLVSEIGRQVAHLPVSVKFGRMLVEARKLGVIEDVVIAASILEHGGVTDRKNPAWMRLCEKEEESDILAQVTVFKEALSGKWNKWRMEENGINVKSFHKVREIALYLFEVLPSVGIEALATTGSRSDILKSILSGMVESVYRFQQYNRSNLIFHNHAFEERSLNKDSVIKEGCEWIVGIPFDIEIKATFGTKKLPLIGMATKVSLDWLIENASHVVKKVDGVSPHWSDRLQSVASVTEIHFGRHVVSSETIADPNHPEAAYVISERNKQLQERERMYARHDAERKERLARTQLVSGRAKPSLLEQAFTDDQPVILKKTEKGRELKGFHAL